MACVLIPGKQYLARLNLEWRLLMRRGFTLARLWRLGHVWKHFRLLYSHREGGLLLTSDEGRPEMLLGIL